MSPLIHAGMIAAAKRRPQKVQDAVPAGAPARSHVAMIKRVGRIALTVALFVIVVSGIVAVKSYVWIPHFGH
jgi:hypothetical protein